MAAGGFIHGPLGAGCLHLCVDMQRVFGPGSAWAAPWLEKILPRVAELAGRHAERTVFTRFIPAERPDTAPGAWRAYHRRWAGMTLSAISPDMLGLLAPLDTFAPPARVLDKKVYSPWTEGRLDDLLRGSDIDTLIVTGGETEICVLATVLGAIDRGYRTVLVADAVFSSVDELHDDLLKLYRSRFSEQLETVTMEEALIAWS